MSIIGTGGYRWSAELVSWGQRGPGSKREILGYVGTKKGKGRLSEDEKKQQIINLWDIEAVYTLFRDDTLIYAGEGILGARLLMHFKGDWLTGKWNHFSWLSPWRIETDKTPHTVKPWQHGGSLSLRGKDIVELLELAIICLCEPQRNSQTPSRNDQITWLYQVPSQYAQPTLEQKVDRLLAALESTK